MGKPRSKLIPYHKLKFREVYGFTTEIHFGTQAKHMPGQPEYEPHRSAVTLDIVTIQKLVLRHAGYGSRLPNNSNKEVVDFGVVIGIYRSRHQKLGNRQLGQISTIQGVVHTSFPPRIQRGRVNDRHHPSRGTRPSRCS
ncbi:polymorphic toxin type 50 domain-containing protein [Actinotignum timonense]|uniref:Bacterial toxin 50 domain-containing protein n=2 Tax=Actinomycetaceae TaxID=2049 RepID=S2VGK0_9ACTO|nr:hypothetical protein HMPREF9237_01177 [Actinotignum schaalii FB123-CNA-2]